MESGIIRQKAAEQTDPTIQSKPIKRHQRSCEAVNGLNESRLNFRLDVLSLLLFGRSQNFQESKGTPSQSSFGSRPRGGFGFALVDHLSFFDGGINRCHPVSRCTQTIFFPTEIHLEAMVLDPMFIYRL